MIFLLNVTCVLVNTICMENNLFNTSSMEGNLVNMNFMENNLVNRNFIGNNLVNAKFIENLVTCIHRHIYICAGWSRGQTDTYVLYPVISQI